MSAPESCFSCRCSQLPLKPPTSRASRDVPHEREKLQSTETEQPSLFSSGLTGKLLEVQVSALHSITRFKWIPAFNSNHIATGSKGKSTPWQLPTQSINLQNSTPLQLTQLGEQSLQTRLLSMQGMSPTVQLRPFWFVLGFSQENFASSTTKSTWIIKIFKDNCNPSKNKTSVWSETWRFLSSKCSLQNLRISVSLHHLVAVSLYCKRISLRSNYALNQSPTSYAPTISYFLYFVNVVLNSNEKVQWLCVCHSKGEILIFMKGTIINFNSVKISHLKFQGYIQTKGKGSTGEYDI